MATVTQQPESSTFSGVLMHGVSWSDYESMLRLIGNRPIRVTYDQGTMEVQMPSQRHEQLSRLIGKLVEEIAQELGLDYQALGMTTWRRPDLARGLESDQCFYIRHEAVARRPQPINLETDPPPDLAIEVDITHSSMDRLLIYAQLGIPEVWRHDGTTLSFLLLQQDGTYAPSPTSPELLGLTSDEAAQLIQQGLTLPTSRWVASIRQFVAAVLAPRLNMEKPDGAE